MYSTTSSELSGAASIAFPARSDATPRAMSSCGAAIGMIRLSWSRVRFRDIASESYAVRSKPAPSRETWFIRFASLTYSMARSVAEMSIVSLNAMVILPVFSLRLPEAKAGLAPSTEASFTI